jgi:hypothetical protein
VVLSGLVEEEPTWLQDKNKRAKKPMRIEKEFFFITEVYFVLKLLFKTIKRWQAFRNKLFIELCIFLLPTLQDGKQYNVLWRLFGITTNTE